MRYVIIGAGAIGGALGGRLRQAGQDVVLVARGAQFEALRERGLRLTAPDGVFELPVPVVDGPDALELADDDVLVLAVKTQDAVAALDAWAARPVRGGGTAGERLPLVCAQNGVEAERLALRRFRRVYGMCVFLPASYLEPGAVTVRCAPYTGALNLGRYPSGADGTAHRIADGLEKANFLVPVTSEVMRWKYAKLLGNLANAVEAVCGSLAGDEAKALVARARAEAVEVLDAAGIGRATDEEQRELRAGRVEVRPVEGGDPAGGSTWQSLRRGSTSVEADYLNGEIVLLGRLHGVATPVNEALLRMANEFARSGREPGSMTAGELAAQLSQ
ncbi:ketopantoate reductase family protein [Actinomadura verrucosospora]|uniref:2-dehydropantoate 2-reductase n=1 Tax=Actinomadura verrucosospora TaxID=46165 RepID=A0A7D3ZKZ8_ACTVE|nr:2-dehydropantoate 2-reductase [Actinomadura verrucosospora]QKG21063.1 ketopantoate reductase ApbA/PanE domain-containing protein [Actinomadura verrucosospora]